VLRALLAHKLKAGHVRLKALLVDPCSETARARVTFEEATEGGTEYVDAQAKRFSETQTFVDIQRSVTTIQTFQKQGLPVEVRFYDCMPFAFFIITATGMIIEQYHLGREIDATEGVCIAENMPLLGVTSTIKQPHGVVQEPPYYQRMRNSFWTLWLAGGPDEDAARAPGGPYRPYRNIFLAVKKLDQVYQEITALRERGSWPKRQTLD